MASERPCSSRPRSVVRSSSFIGPPRVRGGRGSAGVRVRSAASARLVWDFTVPTEIAEGGGRLGLAQLLVVAQDDDRSCLAGQRLDEVPQLGAGAVVVVVVHRPVEDGLLLAVLAPLPGAPPQRVVLVDQDPSHVAVDGALVTHLVPRQVELGERRLREVLGVVAVARQQVRRPQQARLPGGEVRREVGVARAGPVGHGECSRRRSVGGSWHRSSPRCHQDASDGGEVAIVAETERQGVAARRKLPSPAGATAVARVIVPSIPTRTIACCPVGPPRPPAPIRRPPTPDVRRCAGRAGPST